MEKEVIILIPTYFANNMLQNCISSILEHVSQPKILVYKNDIGWLKACNHLIESTKTDVILLNDDTYVLSDIVKELQEVVRKDDSVGIVGGKALSPNEDTIINYGIYIAPDGNTAHKYFGKPRNSVKEEVQRAVEGSCMYIRREVIQKIGLFDEGYGMGYREEVDLCFRAREAGFKIVSTPKAEYVHFVNQTHGRVGIENSTYDYFMSKWGTKLALGKV